MLDLRTLIRPLLALPFIVGGVNTLRAKRPTTHTATDVGAPIGETAGWGRDTDTLVKISAGVQIGAGVILALGFVPRLASLALSASLVPTTITEHRFWEARDPSERNEQMVQFAKHAGLFGGLLSTALDTGGRPSIFWSGRRAAGRAAQNVAGTASGVYHSLPVVS